jgi:hypothetical protein
MCSGQACHAGSGIRNRHADHTSFYSLQDIVSSNTEMTGITHPHCTNSKLPRTLDRFFHPSKIRYRAQSHAGIIERCCWSLSYAGPWCVWLQQSRPDFVYIGRWSQHTMRCNTVQDQPQPKHLLLHSPGPQEHRLPIGRSNRSGVAILA